ncbi:MAG: hypothetical protein KAW16_07315 [candidate division Zixibacteria bacterium]|nr:hypothetical protein [candidate division Zixibacteria bacterium]
MQGFPISLHDYLRAVACETARMSFPGRMSGIVAKGTKHAVEKYFVDEFPIHDIWKSSGIVARDYDNWHKSRVQEMGTVLNSGKYVKDKNNNAEAISAKFLNTFMHQLMKYEPLRQLWDVLHLPLDRRVFTKLTSLESEALSSVKKIILRPPYSITYEEYSAIQGVLFKLLVELNSRPDVEFKLKSRIELNLLWT